MALFARLPRCRVLDAHEPIPCLEHQERPRPDEAVAPQTFAADDALAQERPVAVLDLAERRHGREGIADQLPIDRHEVVLLRQVQVGL